MSMIRKLSVFVAIAAILAVGSIAYAAGPVQVVTPDSGIVKPEDNGLRARTHYRILVPAGGYEKLNAHIDANLKLFGGPPYAGYGYETPASLACIYQLVPPAAGCNPNTFEINATGGSKAIALVDAYHYPYAQADLAAFSTQFGLPAPNLTVVYASGAQPPESPWGWEMEEALDIEWAHAMAPNAKLYLVEAKSNSFADLFKAIDKAGALVAAAGGGEVSMSWGGGEFSTEASYDSHFAAANVVYFASSGDSPGTEYPCVSSKVVCVGGTTLRRNPSTNNFLSEVAWADTGGGVSTYVSKPSYQAGIKSIANRGVPDVALAADPNSGAWVRYTPSDGSAGPAWYIVGGTSWASPSFAGIVNLAGKFKASSTAELTTIYGGIGSGNFRDITTGWCGPIAGWSAVVGWDPCTGVGSSVGTLGK
jgi:subtilase family serine protease